MFPSVDLADMPMTHVVGIALAAVLVLFALRVAFAMFVYIPNTHFGVVERRWSARRSPEPFGPLAFAGNAGFLPELIRGGWHVFPPFQDRVHNWPLINVDQISRLVARVGRLLDPGQAHHETSAMVQVQSKEAVDDQALG